jgi:hypothetical protein
MKYNLKRIERQACCKGRKREITGSLSSCFGLGTVSVICFAFRTCIYYTGCKKHKKNEDFKEFIFEMPKQIHKVVFNRFTRGAF